MSVGNRSLRLARRRVDRERARAVSSRPFNESSGVGGGGLLEKDSLCGQPRGFEA